MSPEDKKDPQFDRNVVAWSDHAKRLIQFNLEAREVSIPVYADFTFAHEVLDSVFYHRMFYLRNGKRYYTQRGKAFFNFLLKKYPKLQEWEEEQLQYRVWDFFRERNSFLHVTYLVRRLQADKVEIPLALDEARWAKLSSRELKRELIDHLEEHYGIPRKVSRMLWNEPLPRDFLPFSE